MAAAFLKVNIWPEHIQSLVIHYILYAQNIPSIYNFRSSSC